MYWNTWKCSGNQPLVWFMLCFFSSKLYLLSLITLFYINRYCQYNGSPYLSLLRVNFHFIYFLSYVSCNKYINIQVLVLYVLLVGFIRHLATKCMYITTIVYPFFLYLYFKYFQMLPKAFFQTWQNATVFNPNFFTHTFNNP